MTTIDQKIRETRAELSEAGKAYREAAKIAKRAESARDRLSDRLDTLKWQKETAKQRKEDLAGEHGVVFELTSTPKELFDKVKKQKFVLTSGEWLLGGASRFRVRTVGGHMTQGYFDVGDNTTSVTIGGFREYQWVLSHEALIDLLTKVRETPYLSHGSWASYQAGRALEHLNKVAA